MDKTNEILADCSLTLAAHGLGIAGDRWGNTGLVCPTSADARGQNSRGRGLQSEVKRKGGQDVGALYAPPKRGEVNPTLKLGLDDAQGLFYPAKVKSNGAQGMPQMALQEEERQNKVGIG